MDRGFISRRHVSGGRQVRPAFTLVELLVVIGIIALLIGILLPVLGKARNSAKTVQCGSNLRQIGLAIQIYVDNEHGFLPPGYASDAQGNLYNWTSILVAQMGRKGGMTSSAADRAQGGADGGFRKLFLCPELASSAANYDSHDNAVSHYLCHPRLMPDLYGTGTGVADTYLINYRGVPAATFQQYRLARVNRSQEIVMVFDGSMTLLASVGANTPGYSGAPYYRAAQGKPIGDMIDNGTVYYGLAYLVNDPKTGTSQRLGSPVAMNARSVSAGSASTPNTDTSGNDRNFRFRHSNNTVLNAVFADGHAATFQASARQMSGSAPTAGNMTCRNVFVDRP